MSSSSGTQNFVADNIRWMLNLPVWIFPDSIVKNSIEILGRDETLQILQNRVNDGKLTPEKLIELMKLYG